MSTKTPNLNLTLPATGDTGWGDTINADLTTIDTAVASKANASALAPVALTGSYADLVNVPPFPVTSVAGKTGAVTLVEGDVANLTTDLASKLSLTGGTLSGALSFGANSTTPDVYIYRDAPGTLALRNGVTPQVFSAYNSYTDAANYERLSIAWVSNQCNISTQHAGTGVARQLIFNADNGYMDFRCGGSQIIELYTGGVLPGSGKTLGTGGSRWTGVFSNADNVLLTSPSTVGVTVQAAALQTADLQDWKDSNGNVLSSVDANGNIVVSAAKSIGWGSTGVSTPDTFLYRDAAGSLSVRGVAGATTYLNVGGSGSNGISGQARLSLNTNVRNTYIELDNASGMTTFSGAPGGIVITSLAGVRIPAVALVAKTANYTLPNIGSAGTVYTNTGAAGAVTITLLNYSQAGVQVSFIVDAAQNLVIQAPTGQTISIGASSSTSGGTCTASTVGNTITLIQVAYGRWVALNYVGTWALA